MQTVRHYWGVYRQFLAVNFAQSLSFRMHFVLLILMDLIFYAGVLFSIDFTFSQVGPLGGWGRNEFLFFASFMLAVDQLHMTFVSENFWRFSVDVRTGQLDNTLLRPCNPIFLLFFQNIRPASMFLIVVPWTLLVYFGNLVELTTVSWLLLPLMVLATLSVLVSLGILLMMSTFWMIDSTAMNFVRMQFQEIARWPDFVYQGWLRRVFSYLLPVLIASTVPVQVLLHPERWLWLGSLVVAQLFLMLAIGSAWRAGLRRYESASR